MPESIDVRASFRRFPEWTQHFWTWFTGKALPSQQPLIRHTWSSYLALTLVAFFGGLSLSAIAVDNRFPLWFVLLLIGWITSLWASRTMILVITHQCIHNRFSGSKKMDEWVAEFVTLLNVYQDAAAFKREHVQAHHREAVFATVEDPPVQVLFSLGFRPGMTTRQLWWRALVVFFSPAFYWNGFKERFWCNVMTGTWRRCGFFVWMGFWLWLALSLARGCEVVLLAFVIPTIVLSQLSALLDKLGEHAWLTSRDPRHGLRYYHSAATWARFCGASVPARSPSLWKGVAAWLRWAVAMVFYHLPARLLVVVGDLPNHDFHHRYPSTPDWMIAAYARQRDIEQGMRGGPPYSEIWGLGAAIHRMFDGLSRAQAMPQTDWPRGVALNASMDR